MSIVGEPDPILRVTVGSPIYTSDDQKIGTVKQHRPNALKVGTWFLQRDYWLAADTVASATASGPVVLRFDRAHLDEHKLRDPPQGV